MTSALAQHPHHDGSPLYVSHDAQALGDTVGVRLRVPDAWGRVVRVRVRSIPDAEPRFVEARVAHRYEGVTWWEAHIPIENPVHRYRFLVETADGMTWWLNSIGLITVGARDVDDFRITAHPTPPEWGADTVLYQVFPDRFGRSSAADDHAAPEWAEPAAWTDDVIHSGPSTAVQVYGGDLPGVTEHLDHLERLGVTALYLTPVFPARSNHRYDATSFDRVDPLLGGDAAFAELVAAAHDRGLRVIGDLTTNHSGDAHEWFRAAHGHPDAAEGAFYYWLDDEHLGYVSWLGVPSLPKFDWGSAELRRRFIEGPDSVVAKWLEPPFSLDGWRIDVANMTGRYRDDDYNRDVRRLIRRTMVEVNPDTLLLGESTSDAAADFDGDSWHGAMTYANFTQPLWAWLSRGGSPAVGGVGLSLGRTQPFDGEEFYRAHRAFAAGFPWRVRLHNMNAIDSHDTPRFQTHAIPGALPVAFGLAVAMPGIPTIFAGMEFGLTGDDGEHSRTPMPWHAVDDAAETIDSVAGLVRLRRENPALARGGIRWLHVSAEAVAFVRELPEQSVLIVATRGAASFELPAGSLPGSDGSAATERLLGHAVLAGAHVDAPALSFTAWRLPGVDLPPFDRLDPELGIGDVPEEYAPTLP